MARITRMLGGATGRWERSPASYQHCVNEVRERRRSLRCRAAVASTLMAGLELAREGMLVLEQDQPWLDIELRPVC